MAVMLPMAGSDNRNANVIEGGGTCMWGSMLLALATGLVIGVVFQTLRIPSPAPPFLGLLGLLGMFLGQNLMPWIKTWMNHQ